MQYAWPEWRGILFVVVSAQSIKLKIIHIFHKSLPRPIPVLYLISSRSGSLALSERWPVSFFQMSQHIPSTTPPTPPTDKLYLSDEETLAITVSPGVLWNYSQQHFVNPPKAFLQVTGSHLVEDGCEQKSTTDFDIWIDCSEKSELEWIQIKDSTGSSVTYNGSAAITSELDSPLGQWYRQYTNNLSQQRG